MRTKACSRSINPSRCSKRSSNVTRKFSSDPAFKKAFHALTPGRQRAYTIHFAGAKQAATRESRIAKHEKRILAGKGLDD